MMQHDPTGPGADFLARGENRSVERQHKDNEAKLSASVHALLRDLEAPATAQGGAEAASHRVMVAFATLRWPPGGKRPSIDELRRLYDLAQMLEDDTHATSNKFRTALGNLVGAVSARAPAGDAALRRALDAVDALIKAFGDSAQAFAKLRDTAAGENAVNESEADEVGLELYIRAGFEPQHYPGRFVSKLQRKAATDSTFKNALEECHAWIKGGKDIPKVEGTHPAACWRIYNLSVSELTKHEKDYAPLLDRTLIVDVDGTGAAFAEMQREVEAFLLQIAADGPLLEGSPTASSEPDAVGRQVDDPLGEPRKR